MDTMSQNVTPIAVIGLACRFPGGANDPEKLWSMLSEGRSAWSEVPPDRFNWEAFYHPNPTLAGGGALNHRGGHFLDKDIRAFEPGFFAINQSEAHAMDPQQRILLETAFEAFENAGLPKEAIRGSNTAVYVSVFSHDYDRMQGKDPAMLGQYSVLGTGDAIFANRISYVFDLKGASITLDTGCSGTLVALHNAVQNLRLGESSMALVGGTNLLTSPDTMIPMSLFGILNPDGKCYPFDSRGEGYGRGEGVCTVVLKRLDDALKAGDPIRAIIRHTGVNQDGRTSSITLPSQDAQQRLIRSVYQEVGLGTQDTSYIEAHGTGTVAGDTAEIKAILEVFRAKSQDFPLHVGSIKGNIGHLESASGLAGLIKAIMILERGWIPPTINLKDFKKELGSDINSIKIPTRLAKFPDSNDKIRRASVNSFGYGGTNAHAIIEQAHINNAESLVSRVQLKHQIESMDNKKSQCIVHNAILESPQLLTFTAHSEASLVTMIQNIAHWANTQHNIDNERLRDLAYTICCRRSLMKWRHSMVVSNFSEVVSKAKISHRPTKIFQDVRVIFVFSGQGSAYFDMGRALIQFYPLFKESLKRSDKAIRDFGAEWSLIEELLLTRSQSRVNQSLIAQPATTALQIALVDLLKSFGIEPAFVLGHSSGEICGAYAAGVLNQNEALKVAYYRGLFANQVINSIKTKGAMLAVGMGESQIEPHISKLHSGTVSVACVNSHTSVTISGDETAIDELREDLDGISVFNRKLLVDTAYHSQHMQEIADSYRRSLDGLSWHDTADVGFISSVTASKKTSDFGPAYWVENLVSKVRFSDALGELCKIAQDVGQDESSDVLHVMLEIGPHSTLSGPIRQSLDHLERPSFKHLYMPSLVRNRDAITSLMEMSGLLFDNGHAMKLDVVNSPIKLSQPLKVLASLPPYPWDHSKIYWNESRLSKEYRFRAHPHHDLLGLRILSNNTNEPIWRNTISVDNLPWLRDHIVDGLMIFPGTGYLCMAIEATRQINLDHKFTNFNRFLLKDVVFHKALVIPDSPSKVEVQISLRPRSSIANKNFQGWNIFQVSCLGQDGIWHSYCYGSIRTESDQLVDYVEKEDEQKFDISKKREMLQSMGEQCFKELDTKELYDEFKLRGNSYGATFKIIKELRRGDLKAVGLVEIPNLKDCMPGAFMQPHVIHPTTFDSLLQVNLPLFRLNCGRGSVVPVSIDEISVSTDLFNLPGSKLTIATEFTPTGSRSGTFHLTAFQENEKFGLLPMITINAGDLRLSGETKTQISSSHSNRNATYQLKWDFDVDFLTRDDIRSHSLDLEKEVDVQVTSQKNYLLNTAADCYMHECLQRISFQKLHILEKYASLFEWMTQYINSQEFHNSWSKTNQSQMPQLLEDVSRDGAHGEMLSRMGNKLASVITGEEDPLSLILENGLLFRVYNEDSSLLCSSYLATFVKSLVFKKPHITVLEIGAGTAGTTLTLFKELEKRGAISFKQYDFTDVSSAFFDPAQELLQKWSGFVKYRKLDIEKDPCEQGFEKGSYDLIIAANSLHTTSYIGETLANVHKLLKPGGRLALIEVTKLPLYFNVTFGLLPGWWKGVDDGRRESPLLDLEGWNKALISGSFSGLDISIDDLGQKCTFMISHAVQKDHKLALAPIEICCFECNPISPMLDSVFQSCGLKSLCTTLSSINKDVIYVVLDSGDTPILSNPSDEEFGKITRLLTQGKRVLWVTISKDGPEANKPEQGLITGLARVTRSENEAIQLVTLHVQQDNIKTDLKFLDAIVEVVFKSFETDDFPDELEYTWRNGQFRVLRLIPDEEVDNFITEETTQLPNEDRIFQSDLHLKLSVVTPGLLTSMVFVNDDLAQSSLAANEIEISVKAWGINFKDVFIALGQMREPARMTGECSGEVIAVGCQSKFQIGDRVCAWNGTPYASHCRVKQSSVYRIPSEMSFDTAASIPIIFLTAYYSLVEIAKLSRHQKILIHAASGGVGQAAIMIAQDIGAEIFATVGSADKRQMLVDRYSIPESHIFSSRSGNFKKGLLRLTQGYGMDVILNSLSGEALQDTWSCIARFGTFVEIGKTDIYQKGQINMAPFDKNVTFSSVDLVILAEHRPEIMQDLFTKVMSLFNKGRLAPVHPITTMPIGDIENAFRLIQARKHVGKVVLRADADSTVKAVPQRSLPLKLDENATYVIAGGQGDLGRKIIDFMCDKGAKYFAILTRRGSNSENQIFNEYLPAPAGVCFRLIRCDITNARSVTLAMDLVKRTMPPIKGVIQAAMVLQDHVLEEMSLEDYQAALKPKVWGTRNLIDALKDHTFDFFIMLSSVCSILGLIAQGNYGAGNAYQDAVANDGSKSNARYISLNLGMIEDSEVLTRHPNYKPVLIRTGCIPVPLQDLLKLIEYSMIARNSGDRRSQIAIGFDRQSISQQERFAILRNPIFNHLPQKSDLAEKKQQAHSAIRVDSAIADASNLDEICIIVSGALRQKISSLIGSHEDNINMEDAMENLGLDSLIAVELKNWISHVLCASVQTSEILDSRNIKDLAALVAKRSTLANSNSNPAPAPNEQNGILSHSTIPEQERLPLIPLPELADSLDQYVESVQSFCTSEDLQRLLNAISHFQGQEGPGIELHNRLIARKEDPLLEDWLSDIYTIDTWTKRRVPINPWQHFFASYPESGKQFSQARQAAIISLAAFQFRQHVQTDGLKEEYLHGQAQSMDLHQWTFNSYLEPGVGIDKIQSVPANNYLIALRNGHIFKVVVDPADSVKSVETRFEVILKLSHDILPSVASLTADARDSWAQIRGILDNASPTNHLLLRLIEEATFVICLDDDSPNSPSSRVNQFLLGGVSNRWSDKGLQFVVCQNGASAFLAEHAMLDGDTLDQLTSTITKAIVETDELEASHLIEVASSDLDQMVEEKLFLLTPDLQNHINRVELLFKNSVTPCEYTHCNTPHVGTTFFRKYNCAPKVAFQITIQLASLLYFGTQHPCLEAVSMRHFHKGRLDFIQTTIPAVFNFCAEACNEETPRSVQRQLFLDAVKALTNLSTKTSRGRGFRNHLLGLRMVLKENEELPELFRDPTFGLIGPGKISTDCISWKGLVQEAGFHRPGEGRIWVHYEVQSNEVQFSIKGPPSRNEIFEGSMERAIQIVKELLESKMDE